MEAGGEAFSYIPCLNSSTDHIAALETIVLEQATGWLGAENQGVPEEG
jgi:ferrochelatase